MIQELINADKRYSEAMLRRRVDLRRAITTNSFYYQSLFEFYQGLTNPEEKMEVAYELNYLNQQLKALHHDQLNRMGGTA
ncbi:MAG: hypothetical protein Q8N99_05430 [Nanoarchaeota archaeon]|nr:hypothetical protein [Nanoarchaeota archaeon]